MYPPLVINGTMTGCSMWIALLFHDNHSLSMAASGKHIKMTHTCMW